MAEAESSALTHLAAWYAAQCDGTWEHRRGVSVQSTDNPGWWVKIDLEGTRLARRVFPAIAVGIDGQGHPVGSQWLSCSVTDGTWNGAGDETRLQEIVERFLIWVDSET